MPALLAGPLAILGMLSLLALLPVVLPVAACLAWWDGHRLRRVAAASDCARCGHVLGTASLDASEAAHIAALGAMQREHPNHLVHVSRRSQARCTACGEDHAWDRRSLTFSPVAA